MSSLQKDQATAAPGPPVAPHVAPQVNNVDVAAVVAGDEPTAGEVISSRHHPGGHADVVSLSQLQDVLREQQMAFQQEMQQQFQQQWEEFQQEMNKITPLRRK